MDGMNATAVQLTEMLDRGRWLAVPNQNPIPTGPRGEEAVTKFTVEISVVSAEFIDRYAAFRNAVAKERGHELRRNWTRKSMAEAMLDDSAKALIDQLQQLTAEVGPLPSADDSKASQAKREQYAREFLKWEREQTKAQGK